MIRLRPSTAAAAVFRWSNYARSSIRRISQSGKLEALYCEPGSEGRHHTRRQREHILGLTYARLSCTAVSRLIRALDTRKTRARLDRLVRDGKIQRKREQGTHGPVYLFRRHS
jgi:hypothetical protein